jgi:hypothetical protein
MKYLSFNVYFIVLFTTKDRYTYQITGYFNPIFTVTSVNANAGQLPQRNHQKKLGHVIHVIWLRLSVAMEIALRSYC